MALKTEEQIRAEEHAKVESASKADHIRRINTLQAEVHTLELAHGIVKHLEKKICDNAAIYLNGCMQRTSNRFVKPSDIPLDLSSESVLSYFFGSFIISGLPRFVGKIIQSDWRETPVEIPSTEAELTARLEARKGELADLLRSGS